MKVLVVEDHVALAKLTCRVLHEIYDHQVGRAENAAAAIEEFLDLQPELVLVDLDLPDMDGCQLAQRLRGLPGGEAPVLVALTGFGNLIDEDSAEAAGFDALFRKPMNFDLLADLRRRA
jgi:CheY-like chemotaxis protein